MTTNQGGKWVVQEDDVLAPPDDQGVRVTMGIIVNPEFHYTGSVKDAQGLPVAGAEVVLGTPSQPKADSWDDSHRFGRTTTDAHGQYDLSASSPWGTFLEAEDKTHGRVDLKWPGYDSPPIPPGRYDLVFPAKPALDR
jgi:protocatechuate 3,4-dioxygenase beta subunit